CDRRGSRDRRRDRGCAASSTPGGRSTAGGARDVRHDAGVPCGCRVRVKLPAREARQLDGSAKGPPAGLGSGDLISSEHCGVLGEEDPPPARPIAMQEFKLRMLRLATIAGFFGFLVWGQGSAVTPRFEVAAVRVSQMGPLRNPVNEATIASLLS